MVAELEGLKTLQPDSTAGHEPKAFPSLYHPQIIFLQRLFWRHVVLCKYDYIFQSSSAVFVVNSFMRVRIVTKSANYLCRVRLSACISVFPTGRISEKFDIGDFMKIC